MAGLFLGSSPVALGGASKLMLAGNQIWPAEAPAGPSVPPAFQSISTVVNSQSISRPSGVVAGDLLVGVFMGYNDDTPTVNVPSGWTEVGSIQSRTNPEAMYGRLAYKIAGASEPTSYAYSIEQAYWYPCAVIARYTDFDPVTPIEALASNTGTASPRSAPSVTSTLDNSRLVVVSMGYDYSASVPAGMTQRAAWDSVSYFYDEVRATAGATGARSHSQSGQPNGWLDFAFIIRGNPAA